MGNHTIHNSPTVNTGVFLKLPTTDGSNGQVISTNGSGTLSFTTDSETKPTISDTSQTIDNNAPVSFNIGGTNFKGIQHHLLSMQSDGSVTNC